MKWCPIAYAPTADGMVLWLDASALALLDGSSVAEWDDLSGNYNHAGQTDEARQPTYVVSGLDGMPVVQFDGSNHMDVGKSLHGLGIEREAAIFVVVSSTLSTEVTVHDVLSDWASTAGGATVRIRPNGGLEVYVYPNDHRATSATGIVAADEFFVFTSHWFADSHVLYKNGVSVASTALTDDVGDAETLKIGARGDLLDRSFLHGDIAEILIYDRALTSEEREEVEQYLSSKWGL